MALTVYPSTPKPMYSYIVESQYKTGISDFDQGAEERYQRWAFSKRTFQILYRYQNFNSTSRDAIYEFYQNRLGPYEPFWYFDFQKRRWVDQKVGNGDGIEGTFDFPGNCSAATVYVNGSATTFTLSATSGEGNSDQIIFNPVPGTASTITADFTGYLRIKGRFKEDKLVEDIVTTTLVNLSVSIMEIFNT